MNEYQIFMGIKKVIGRNNLLRAVDWFNLFLRKFVSVSHAWQLRLEWGGVSPPEWFNHFNDQYWQWRARRNPLWLERGCFSLLAVNQGAKVLELCCGDGFNAYHFYSIRAKKIMAVDFCQEAINHARKHNQADNIKFKNWDIRRSFPRGKFNNVIWDGAIEHFTRKEIDKILLRIKLALKTDGILSGYTVLEDKNGKKMHTLHEYEFKSREDLVRLLASRFKKVRVFETGYSTRTNLYFFASDGILPFDNEWPWQTVKL